MINYNAKTKVVATLGPKSRSPEVLTDLIKAGVDVFRLNFSHGTHEEHGKTIEMIHQINKELSAHTAILADLQGPKIRLGELENGPFDLEKGDKIILTTQKIKGTREKVYLSYDRFAEDVKEGEIIRIDDGKIDLEVTKILNKQEVELTTVFGGTIRERKGVNLPNTQISLPSLTQKDITDLEYILTQNISWIALSFVRSANDIIKLRGMIEFKAHPAKIIAKIEKPEAVTDLANIIEAADAVMVARGDLGVEIPVEDVPSVQKQIVNQCVAASKPVIIATQMMESMISNSMPTRAEITDVANAIYDGADAVMLSGETAVGMHPVKVVETMQRILERSEEDIRIYNRHHFLDKSSPKYVSDAICYNTISIAEEIGAKAVIATTKSGYTAFTLSSFRPKAKIYAFTENKELLDTLSLLWGVRAFYYDNFVDLEESITAMIEILKGRGLVEKKDIVLFTAAIPISTRGATNMIRVCTV